MSAAVEVGSEYERNDDSAVETYNLAVAEAYSSHSGASVENHSQGFFEGFFRAVAGGIDAIANALTDSRSTLTNDELRLMYPRNGWHDVQIGIRGVAAVDLSSHFVTV